MFGAVKLTKYSDIDKYKYSGYGIAFDRKGKFSFGYGFGRNVIFLGVDMSSFVLVDNKKKFLILGQGIIQGLDDNNMKKTGLNGYVYDFSVDYRAIAADKILDIHKYLMENNNIV